MEDYSMFLFVLQMTCSVVLLGLIGGLHIANKETLKLMGIH